MHGSRDRPHSPVGPAGVHSRLDCGTQYPAASADLQQIEKLCSQVCDSFATETMQCGQTLSDVTERLMCLEEAMTWMGLRLQQA